MTFAWPHERIHSILHELPRRCPLRRQPPPGRVRGGHRPSADVGISAHAQSPCGLYVRLLCQLLSQLPLLLLLLGRAGQQFLLSLPPPPPPLRLQQQPTVAVAAAAAAATHATMGLRAPHFGPAFNEHTSFGVWVLLSLRYMVEHKALLRAAVPWQFTCHTCHCRHTCPVRSPP